MLNRGWVLVFISLFLLFPAAQAREIRKMYVDDFKNHTSGIDYLIGDKSLNLNNYELKNKSRSLLGTSINQITGNQNLLVAQVYDPDLQNALDKRDSLNTAVFGESGNSLKSYIESVSKSQTLINGDVSAPIAVENLCTGDVYVNASNAVLELSKIYNLKEFDGIILSHPSHEECNDDRARGSLGRWTFFLDNGSTTQLSVAYMPTSASVDETALSRISVYTHEYGHNLGLIHSNANSCGEQHYSSECPSVEYGGVFSTMGANFKLGHFTATEQLRLGWLGEDDTQVLELEEEDSFSQEVYLTPLSKYSSGTKYLQIKRDLNSSFAVEYRSKDNFDAIDSGVGYLAKDFDGFLVYYNNDNHHMDSVLLNKLGDYRSNLTLLSSGDSYNINYALDYYKSSTFKTEFEDSSEDIRIINLANDAHGIRLLVQKNIAKDTTVDFSYTELGAGSFQFDNLTAEGASPKTYYWDFGDGSPFSNQTDPLHTYTEEGIYTIKLVAVGEGDVAGSVLKDITISLNADDDDDDGSTNDTEDDDVNVTTTSSAWQLNASATAAIGVEVSFNVYGGSGIVPTKVEWDFDGDGTVDETVAASRFVQHVYDTYGNKTLKAKVYSGGKSFEFSKQVEVKDLVTYTTSYSGTSSIITLRKKGTRSTIVLDNNDDDYLQHKISVPQKYQGLIKVRRKKDLWIFQNTNVYLRFRLAPRNRFKKRLSLNEDGLYELELDLIDQRRGKSEDTKLKLYLSP